MIFNMKTWWILGIVFFGLATSVSLEANESVKGSYKYNLRKHRGSQVLLIFAPEKSSPAFQTQLKSILNKSKVFNDKKTRLYYVFEKGEGRADDMILREVDASDLRQLYNLRRGEFQLRLIGRDGKTRWTKSQPLSLEALQAEL